MKLQDCRRTIDLRQVTPAPWYGRYRSWRRRSSAVRGAAKALVPALLLLTPVATRGLINPNFTPVELVEDSTVIVVGSNIIAAENGTFSLGVGDILKGAPAQLLTITVPPKAPGTHAPDRDPDRECPLA